MILPFSKGFGQNFIINPGICPRIAEAAGIGPGWGVLEIGPGIGVLTEQLCRRADRVVSIEVDKRLPALLAETMAGFDKLQAGAGGRAQSGPEGAAGGRIREQAGGGLRQPALLHHQPHPDAPAGRKTSHPQHHSHGPAGGRPAPVRGPRHPGGRGHQLCGGLLCRAPPAVHTCSRAAFTRPPK